MLKEQDIKRISDFTERCSLASGKLVTDKNTFSQAVLKALADIFGYDTSIMGILPGVESGSLFAPMVFHGINMEFVQKAFNFYGEMEKLVSPDGRFVLSTANLGIKNAIYSRLLEPNGYTDMMVTFITSPVTNKYCCYIMQFSNRIITPYDVELMDYIKRIIAASYHVVLNLWSLNNRHEMLVNTLHYFPIGIMMTTALNEVIYVNDVAQEYLQELGVSNPKLYGTFYENEIYPYHQNSSLRVGHSRPLRYKGFLFNVVFTSNPGISLSEELALSEKKPDPGAPEKRDSYRGMFENMATCIYIIRDDIYHTKFSQETLEHFKFTKGECELVELIADGLSNSEIADRMDIKFNTARIHISNVFKKANAVSRVEFLNILYNFELNNMIREDL